MFSFKNPLNFIQKLHNFQVAFIIFGMNCFGMFPYKYDPNSKTMKFKGRFSKIRSLLTQTIMVFISFSAIISLLDPDFTNTIVISVHQTYIRMLSIIQLSSFTFVTLHFVILFTIRKKYVLKIINDIANLKTEMEKWKTNPNLDESFLRMFMFNSIFSILVIFVCYDMVFRVMSVKGGLFAVAGLIYQTYIYLLMNTVLYAGYLFLAHCLKVINLRLLVCMQRIERLGSENDNKIKYAEHTNICCDLSDEIDALASFQLKVHKVKDDLIQSVGLALLPCLLSTVIIHVVQLIEVFQYFDALFGADEHAKQTVSIGIMMLVLQEINMYFIVSGPEKVLKRVMFSHAFFCFLVKIPRGICLITQY